MCLGKHLAGSVEVPHIESSSSEASTARSLAGQWGLTSWRKFLQVAGEDDSVESVLNSGSYNSLVVAVLGDRNSKPVRRNVSFGEPFLDHSNVDAEHAKLLGLAAVNAGALVIEAALGRPLFPFKVTPVAMKHLDGGTSSFAVWNVTSGELYIDKRLFASFATSLHSSSGFLPSFAAALPQQLSHFIRLQSNASTPDGVVTKLVAEVLPGSIAVASLAMPVWFCIACPIVLGLLAPFAFNFGFGSAAGLICQHYSLPAQECNDLWYGAFAIAMVLSLASAIPIVYICQLPRCGKRT